MKYIFLAIALFPALIHSMDNRTVTLHTGQTVSQKKFDELWPKLKKLTDDKLQSGLHYSLYSLCHGQELSFNNIKQQFVDAGFPTHPSQIDEDAKKIILATNALSLSAEKRIELEKDKEFTFDFINPINPAEGYCEATWD